ncbi:MAG TPA: hypothetical protein VJA25_09785, partial [Dehalococcoidia bacterium]|nr:hypothetical protein [Dehalococcoidia bacterium]
GLFRTRFALLPGGSGSGASATTYHARREGVKLGESAQGPPCIQGASPSRQRVQGEVTLFPSLLDTLYHAMLY